MKAQELRIGNFIEHITGIIVVDCDDFELIKNDPCEYMPIPLTEQWLLDFGFERGVDYWFKGDVILDISPEGLSYRFHYNIIQYVHQLQNLYFALTGEELQL